MIRASFASACFMSMIWSSRERNRSCAPVSRRSLGRIANPPLDHSIDRESRPPIRGNPKNQICKETAVQTPKSGKSDYFITPEQPACSIAWEFFTDDYVSEGRYGGL